MGSRRRQFGTIEKSGWELHLPKLSNVKLQKMEGRGSRKELSEHVLYASSYWHQTLFEVLANDLQQTLGQCYELNGPWEVTQTHSRGKQMLPLLEVDELRVLPGRCLI
eukprot:6204872-Pleurochrysis_carterae.AAC.1